MNTTIEVGGMVVLSCQATGDPAPRYQWKMYGDIYRAGTGYDTNRLVLKDVILNDAGIYHCEAINSLGAAESKKVTLNVVGMCSDLSIVSLSHGSKVTVVMIGIANL